MVAISNEAGAPSLTEKREAEAAAALQGVRALPLVGKVLDHFPGAEIIAVRNAEPSVASDAHIADAADDDVAYTDQAYYGRRSLSHLSSERDEEKWEPVFRCSQVYADCVNLIAYPALHFRNRSRF